MILDSTLKFSADQAVTDTAVSTNVIDLGVSGRDIGIGETVPLRVSVTESFATLTSLTVSVETSDTENFASSDVVIQTGAVPVASLVNGYVFNINEVPKGVVGRYMRLNYTVAGTTATAGAITAGITAGNQNNG